jgi:hypothetical protein
MVDVKLIFYISVFRFAFGVAWRGYDSDDTKEKQVMGYHNWNE